jgi:hypothetical protein
MEHVVAVASVLDVGAAAHPEAVVAGAAVDRVVAGATADHVVAVAAVQRVPTAAAPEPVVARSAVDRVVAGRGVDAVVAAERVDRVVPGPGGDEVRTLRAGEGVGAHRPLDPDDLVGSGDAGHGQRRERDEPQDDPLPLAVHVSPTSCMVAGRILGAVGQVRVRRS